MNELGPLSNRRAVFELSRILVFSKKHEYFNFHVCLGAWHLYKGTLDREKMRNIQEES